MQRSGIIALISKSENYSFIESGLWVRPAKMFFEEIEVDGRRIRRFEKV